MAACALITGASYGIGYELARIFARQKYDLILTARSRGRLEEVAVECRVSGGKVEVIEKDMSLATAPGELFDEVSRLHRPVDVLVNNAGFGSLGRFVDSDLPTQLGMLQVNIVALTNLTRLFLPQMVLRKAGKILNVASMAAYQPGPLMAVYFASKAYVLSFSEALDSELAGSGVRVTALCPGPTATEFQKRARAEGARLFKDNVSMSAIAVAEAGFAGLIKGRRVVIPGVRNRLLGIAARYAPRRLATAVAKRLNTAGR